MDPLFGFAFYTMFLIILAFFVVSVVRGIFRWHKNNNSPRLTVTARVVGKRQHSSHNQQMMTTSTSYYATFEFSSSDRMEFSVSSYEYAMLCEGDFGDLTFQGTRYISFERK